VTTAALERRSLGSRTWAALVAGWGAFIGILPHVLHHVGPLAGAALLPARGERRSSRRSWRAPAIALAVFAGLFSLSSFVIGPAISGAEDPERPRPGLQQPADHEQHH